MIASDIMNRSVRIIGPLDDVRAAARIMAESGVSALPVVDQADRVVGIVSEGDLLRRVEMRTTKRRSWWLELFASPEALTREYIKSHSVKVSDVMSSPVISVAETTSVADVASILEKHGIKRVTVLKNGTLVGIISRADVLRAFSQLVPSSRSDTSDHAIRNTFLQRFNAQSWTPSIGITVSVCRGRVVLEGPVASQEQRQALTVMAETIPGVAEVDNQTVIFTAIPTMA